MNLLTPTFFLLISLVSALPEQQPLHRSPITCRASCGSKNNACAGPARDALLRELRCAPDASNTIVYPGGVTTASADGVDGKCFAKFRTPEETGQMFLPCLWIVLRLNEAIDGCLSGGYGVGIRQAEMEYDYAAGVSACGVEELEGV